jgi:Uma2 family endonuclease
MELVPRTDDRPLANPALKLTYEDFLLFPDDGKRHELIDGEHYVTASPNRRHQESLGNLHLVIGSWVKAERIGKVFLAPFDVVFSNFDVVEPDLIYVSNERAAEILTHANIQGVPELVVEIGSPSTRKRDETIKKRLYERSGVSEYWVVDPDIEVVRVYRRGDSGYGRPNELRLDASDVLTTPLLPGLEIALELAFRD